MTFVRVADGLYKRGDAFYYRPKKPDGARTWRKVKGCTIKEAKANLGKATGLDSGLLVGEAIQIYLQANCPDKRRLARHGRYLKQERVRCVKLMEFWRGQRCAEITAALLDDYADWRIKNRAKGHGGRAADLDLVTLRNVMRWVVRKGLLVTDPFKLLTVSSYRAARIRHCREVAPKSGDELHELARLLFEDPRSAVLGWLTLITAMVGGRVSEMLDLRTDAKHGEPGHISDGVLWLRRRKKGANNFFHIHPDLLNCLEAFFQWRKLRKKKSHWWFAGRDPAKALDIQSLTHALRRAGLLLKHGPRTAHGLRSFYVTCRRSAGLSDSQIALETGQISGGRQIVQTYGDAVPVKVSWMPSRVEPAWAVYQKDTIVNHSEPRLRIVKKPNSANRSNRNRTKPCQTKTAIN